MEFNSKTQEINDVIEKLYSRCEKTEFDEILIMLDKIYLIDGEIDTNFRHEYSQISGKMKELCNYAEDEINPYDIQNISTNINGLYEYAGTKNKEYMQNLFKLKDHICLEIGRILYSNSISDSIVDAKSELHIEIQKSMKEIKDITNRVEEAKNILTDINEKYEKINMAIVMSNQAMTDIETKIQNSREDLEDSKKKIKSYQQESIAILGIFAAIVLAFTGGIAYTSSVLQNFNTGSIYRVLIVIILIGFVITNILFALFYYIDKLVNEKYSRQIKPLWITNCIFIVGIIIVVCLWCNGVVEKVQKNNSAIVSSSYDVGEIK